MKGAHRSNIMKFKNFLNDRFGGKKPVSQRQEPKTNAQSRVSEYFEKLHSREAPRNSLPQNNKSMVGY